MLYRVQTLYLNNFKNLTGNISSSPTPVATSRADFARPQMAFTAIGAILELHDETSTRKIDGSKHPAEAFAYGGLSENL